MHRWCGSPREYALWMAFRDGKKAAGNFRRDTAELAVSLLLEGQRGWWPLTTRAGIMSEPVWVSTAEEVFPYLGTMDYLGPWGFSRQHRDKASAAESGNLLWQELYRF